MFQLVSVKFRKLVFELYPALVESESFRSLMCYLLFPYHHDKEDQTVLISAVTLARLEDKTEARLGRHYCGENLLKSFKERVMPNVVWVDHVYIDGKCRMADYTLPPHIDAALEVELNRSLDDSELVDFVTGRANDRRERSVRLKHNRIEASRTARFAANEDAGMILKYLNSLPPNGFTEQLQYVEEARKLAKKTLEDRPLRDQFRKLSKFEAQPVPVYTPSEKGNSPRLYGLNEGLTTCKREVRAILTQGWVQADLRNAQLAIVAKLWKIPDIEEFLCENDSVWPELCRHLGADLSHPHFKEVKSGIKTVLYATTFGMGKREGLPAKADEELSEYIGCPERILEHWIIQKLLKARSEQMKMAFKTNMIEDCYGKQMKVSTCEEIRSALAQQAQAVEMALIAPIYQLAIANPDKFRVMLHLHDGVYIKFFRAEEKWRRRIKEDVDAKASEFGIETGLDWD